MKFVSFEQQGLQKPGLLLPDGRIADIQATVRKWIDDGAIAAGVIDGEELDDVHSLIVHHPTLLPLLMRIEQSAPSAAVLCRPDVTLLAPIPRPRKNIFCVGRNYIDHVTEGYNARGLTIHVPEHPQFFSKPPTTVVGPQDAIPFDAPTMSRLDYEVELGVVIGKSGKNISAEEVYDYVFGYTVINDLTARDLQRKHDQWFKGKGLDASCPMGPAIVHKDEIKDPQNLSISLSVNGELRQRARTSQMIFDLSRIISDLSQGMTLEAGDIVATGTPSGVGYAMSNPSFLVPGDIVRCEIESVGTIENRIGTSDQIEHYKKAIVGRAHVQGKATINQI